MNTITFRRALAALAGVIIIVTGVTLASPAHADTQTFPCPLGDPSSDCVPVVIDPSIPTAEQLQAQVNALTAQRDALIEENTQLRADFTMVHVQLDKMRYQRDDWRNQTRNLLDVTRGLPYWLTTPCASEGSVNCAWNAHAQGNGIGHSYVVRQFPGHAHTVCVMYVNPSFAARNDYCEDER